MKTRPALKRHSAFTLVEILVSCAVASVVGLAILSFLNAGMYLAAKNFSLNLTSNQMRDSLDRLEQVLQQGDTDPTLIDTTGATVSGSAAAGVKVDRFLGGPYVVTTSGSGLASSVTQLVVTRSTNSMASPPIPSVGDVIRLDGTTSATRPRVSSASAAGVDGSLHQAITCNLASALGTTVSVSSTSVLTAKLVHQVGFIVMPNGSKYELRYYSSIETTTNLNDPTQYYVLSDQLANQSGDTTPFSITQVNAKNFVTLSLRVRNATYDSRLKKKQLDEYNTFCRVDSSMRPKVNP